MKARARTDAVIVHCSDSPGGTVADVREWHKANGWADVGYHYVIENGRTVGGLISVDSEDGLIRPGRDEWLDGAHARGWNDRAIGVCLMGRAEFSRRQRGALYALAASLLHRHGLGPSALIGHCELDPRKTCPNLDMDRVRAKVGLLFGQFHLLLRNGSEVIRAKEP